MKRKILELPVDSSVEFIKRWEGCRLAAYRCSAGVLTIGYGHTWAVKEDDVITQEQADTMLLGDVLKFSHEIAPLLKTDITEGQKIAVLSFVFNLGTTAFKNSTLLKKLNSGDIQGASKEFEKWCLCDGKPLEGLKRRRIAERDAFLS